MMWDVRRLTELMLSAGHTVQMVKQAFNEIANICIDREEEKNKLKDLMRCLGRPLDIPVCLFLPHRYSGPPIRPWRHRQHQYGNDYKYIRPTKPCIRRRTADSRSGKKGKTIRNRLGK
jgi:hypothetical protein